MQSNNQNRLLDRRKTMLKRNEMALRKTRKQVISLLKKQRTFNSTPGRSKKRVSIMIRQKDIKRALIQENKTSQQNGKTNNTLNNNGRRRKRNNLSTIMDQNNDNGNGKNNNVYNAFNALDGEQGGNHGGERGGEQEEDNDTMDANNPGALALR